MIQLIPYRPEMAETLAPFIVSFWQAHHCAVSLDDAMNTPREWTADEHLLFAIALDGALVGFLRVHNSSPSVCWIDDIFVEESQRGKGIASTALRLLEAMKKAEGCGSFCMEVVPDNLAALRLYHRLGYDRLSMVVMRKDTEPFETERIETINGLPLRVKRFET